MNPAFLRQLYILSKPGIIRGNLIHIVAGVLLASTNGFSIRNSVLVCVGTSLIIASACALNNHFDRKIDALMIRTKKRPSATGQLSVRSILLFTVLTASTGIGVLLWLGNWRVLILAVVSYVLYAFVYTFLKRSSVHSTLVGAIPGALPFAAGYLAINDSVNIALIVGTVLVLVWQMPHFYAISIYRRVEYQAAHVPVLGAVASFEQTRLIMVLYLTLYVSLVSYAAAKSIFAPLGSVLLIAATLYWVWVFSKKHTDEETWAKRVFLASLSLPIALLLASTITFLFSDGSGLY